MLRRKYYAQRNNSKGPMNTSAVSASNSSRLHKLTRKCNANVKNVQDRTAGEKIEFVHTRTIQCATVNGTNPSYNGQTCSNPCQGLNVTKAVRVAQDQSHQVDKVKSGLNCGTDDFWGADPVHKDC